MTNTHLQSVAQNTLDTFEDIAEQATNKISSFSGASAENLASVNSMTSSQVLDKLSKINTANRESYHRLLKEPAIARVTATDDKGRRKTYYISRATTSLVLNNDAKLASYRSPIGQLASLPVGDERTLIIAGQPHHFQINEKLGLNPLRSEEGWDSLNGVFQSESTSTLSLYSLRAWLQIATESGESALDLMLSKEEMAAGVLSGLAHQLRTAITLRDQPILDQFQDEIFRLPIDSQLLILGPPGTGKTTTLIKRLGQKLSIDDLQEGEKRYAITNDTGLPHAESWLLFTPSELLKHYVKEAFNREQVPASDDKIKTWEKYRHDISRNVLGILRSNNSSGRYILKLDACHFKDDVLIDPRKCFEAFESYHKARVRMQLVNGIEIAESAAQEQQQKVITQIAEMLNSSGSLRDIYSAISQLESTITDVVSSSKTSTDATIRGELNRQFNKDKGFLDDLSEFLTALDSDEIEDDDDSQFDDDSTELEAQVTQTERQKAARAYTACLRNISRAIFLKKTVPKSSRAAMIEEWLRDRVPEKEILEKIGQGITLQNGLRRFINPSKRYVADIPANYNGFRKNEFRTGNFYRLIPENSRHIEPTELDILVLLMLRTARELLGQRFVLTNISESKFNLLANIASQFRNQVFVDEATDFSMLQLSCVEQLTDLKSRSFFVCGDFNQRITQYGIRDSEQFNWVSKRIENKTITTVYRQSQKLNDFAGELLSSIGGDLSTLGKLPEDSIHIGVPPALLIEGQNLDFTAQWLSARIAEVEKSVQQMPTVAILVSTEDEVQPMADALNELLEDMSLHAVACNKGQFLGEGTDIRVFDIRHIKGLEFEAVFFVNIDDMAQQMPELFGRYLYVGATRAATYLGITCNNQLPESVASLQEHFVLDWGLPTQ